MNVEYGRKEIASGLSTPEEQWMRWLTVLKITAVTMRSILHAVFRIISLISPLDIVFTDNSFLKIKQIKRILKVFNIYVKVSNIVLTQTALTQTASAKQIVYTDRTRTVLMYCIRRCDLEANNFCPLVKIVIKHNFIHFA